MYNALNFHLFGWVKNIFFLGWGEGELVLFDIGVDNLADIQWGRSQFNNMELHAAKQNEFYPDYR